MFIPIGDAPNPKGTPYLTYLLIAANVAVFLLINLPLGAQRPDYDDPRFREYVEVMSQELQGRASCGSSSRRRASTTCSPSSTATGRARRRPSTC